MNVYLVDGTYELFRCFHGAPRETSSNGHEVGAARALLATLVSLVHSHEPMHAAVAFDSVVAPPRRKGDHSAEALIGAQAPLAAAIVRALGLTVWPAGRYQADEIISTAAAHLAQNGAVEKVIICSNDNDFAQCVQGERVVVLDRSRKITTDAAAVRAQFGVEPGQIPDLFGLIGDRSDGLPGVPGWGKVSAAAILARYGRIEAIPSDAAEWDVPVRGKERLAAALEERRDEALLCRDLSVLRTDLPVPVDAERLRWHGADQAAIAAIVGQLEDDSAATRITHWR